MDANKLKTLYEASYGAVEGGTALAVDEDTGAIHLYDTNSNSPAEGVISTVSVLTLLVDCLHKSNLIQLERHYTTETIHKQPDGATKDEATAHEQLCINVTHILDYLAGQDVGRCMNSLASCMLNIAEFTPAEDIPVLIDGLHTVADLLKAKTGQQQAASSSIVEVESE